MIFDCFPFFNELDLLEVRLNTMNNFVDYFVLVEGTKTFTNKDKPLYFYANKKRFAPFLDKILYYCLEDYPPFTSAWIYENLQRNQISAVLKQVNPSNSDTIILSDMDEIPNPATLMNYVGKNDLFQLGMSTHPFYLNCRTNAVWYAGMMASYHCFTTCLDNVVSSDTVYCPSCCNEGTTPSKIRMLKDHPQIPKIDNAGWHFHGLGGLEAMKTKIASSPFTEEPTLNMEYLRRWVVHEDDCSLHLEGLEIIDEKYPHYIQNNLRQFVKYIHPWPYICHYANKNEGF